MKDGRVVPSELSPKWIEIEVEGERLRNDRGFIAMFPAHESAKAMRWAREHHNVEATTA